MKNKFQLLTAFFSIVLLISFSLFSNANNIFNPLLLSSQQGSNFLLASKSGADKLKNSRVLVYTKNGKGYVHDNIAASVICIQELGAANKFMVDVSDDPSVFNENNLKKYNLLIFSSTNNDVFDTDDQRLAFRRYIEAGGGFVGVHSVTGTERNWTWFKMMVGETFTWHASFQNFTIKNIDPSHPSMQGVPLKWTKSDEC